MKSFGKLSIVALVLAFIVLGGCAKRTVKGSAGKETKTTQQAAAKQVTAPTVNKPPAATLKSVTTPEISTSELRNIIKNASSTIFRNTHFDFDKAVIKKEDFAALRNMAQWLIKHPRVRVRIEGNCDERGTQEYNIALGWRRANVVKNYFTAIGVSEDQISMVSYGKDNPIDPAHNKVAWAKNRRDHFTLMIK